MVFVGGINYISILVPLTKMAATSNPNWTDVTDVAIGMICLYSGPTGWVIGGVYFLANVVIENKTGNSIGGWLYDFCSFMTETRERNRSNTLWNVR